MAGPLAGGEGGRQGVLHPRGGQLVQRDGDLPDGPDETREHPRYVISHCTDATGSSQNIMLASDKR